MAFPSGKLGRLSCLGPPGLLGGAFHVFFMEIGTMPILCLPLWRMLGSTDFMCGPDRSRPINSAAGQLPEIGTEASASGSSARNFFRGSRHGVFVANVHQSTV